LGCGTKEAGKLGYSKSFDIATKTVNGNTTVNDQRKDIPNGWSCYSKTVRVIGF